MLGYEVSNYGNVRHKKRKNNLKPNDKGKGYKQLHCRIEGKRKVFYIHRLVAQEFCDNPNNYKEINHKNGKKNDNNSNNLEWCSRSENMKHALNNGLYCLKKPRKDNKLKLRNININNNGWYVVKIQRNYKIISKGFKTLEKAIEYRDKTLKEME